MAKIAVVEDEMSLALAYRTILEKHGYEVVLAHDGKQALEMVAKDKPDLILLDMKMPHMGGLDFLRQLDAETAGKVIVFSNQDTQDDIDEAFRLGAQHYLLKSWAAPHDLIRVVKEGLET